ncbi:hypothetical protein GCK32_013736 [Trichostrongylus colubriformis]|uniref:Uncharacterized protein n=1 Tax=Trichostrongylus colubriformis TaxID=6319 RepID=A0AAN8FIY3_TRICO
MCNCTALSLSYLAKDDLDDYPLCDYTKCEVDVQKGNYSDAECTKTCYRDCRQIRYEIDHEVQGKMVRPDLTLINLNWGSFEYLTMEQQWKYSITAFIAALGGSIGMWLGLSILSLIQGGTYLYSYFTRKVVKEKLLKKISQQQQRRRESRASHFHNAPLFASGSLDGHSKKISIGANPFENPFVAPSRSPSRTPSFELDDVSPPGYSRSPNPTKIQVD